jgi:serine/threonine-protein kinase HipA
MNHLSVKLGRVAVGDLRRRSGDSWEFQFRPEYRNLHPRPVLGQFFEDDLARVHRENLCLPAFFSNLLPEGPLRKLVARKAGVSEQREAYLLEVLGGDLPGAVVVERANGEDLDEEEESPDRPVGAPQAPTRLKFSLAGVQLKFSVLREGTRLNLPASGQGGRWIVKCPDPVHPGLPANEISMLRWARRAGFAVPDHDLVPIADLHGLPDGLSFPEAAALAVRRYDRADTSRIHQEDFAQVLGLFPGAKYDRYNYETIGNYVRAVAGPAAFVEFAKRLAFVVLSGNGDAHHKNWSLLYPDRVHATLAPAYDLVFTRAYDPKDDLALNFGGSKSFFDVTVETFRRLARKSGYDEQRLADAVGEAAAAIREAWKEVGSDLPIDPEAKARLSQHLGSMRF